MPKVADIFAARLHQIRKSQGLTQEQLSSLTGLSKNTICNYEGRKGFTLEGLSKVAKALGVEESVLVQAEEPSEPLSMEINIEDALNHLKQHVKRHRHLQRIPLDVAELLPSVTDWEIVKKVLELAQRPR